MASRTHHWILRASHLGSGGSWGYRTPLYLLNHLIRLQAVVEIVSNHTTIALEPRWGLLFTKTGLPYIIYWLKKGESAGNLMNQSVVLRLTTTGSPCARPKVEFNPKCFLVGQLAQWSLVEKVSIFHTLFHSGSHLLTMSDSLFYLINTFSSTGHADCSHVDRPRVRNQKDKSSLENYEIRRGGSTIMGCRCPGTIWKTIEL